MIKLQEAWLQDSGLYKCPECGIEKTRAGICSHIFYKHTDKGKKQVRKRIDDIRNGNIKVGNKIGFNKGKTNIELYGEEKAKLIKEKVSKALKGKSKGKGATEKIENERRRKISETMKKNPKSGGLRVGSGRGVKTWYESKIAGKVYLRSTYELEYAKWLDKNDINWKQNLESFLYVWEGKEKKYYPDFYLIDENCFIEVKGFKTTKDEAKWESFPYQLKVLYYNDLFLLGLNVKK